MMSPMAYPLCRQRVTLYRKTEAGVSRQVLEGCFLRWQDCLTDGENGPRFQRKFLLIVPGAVDIRPGDRVQEGDGAEVADWDSFLPVTVPGLCQVQYAIAHKWQAEVCHTEAGRK